MYNDTRLLNQLWRWLSGNSEPLGYCPGATLAMVEQNFRPLECQRYSDRILHVRCPQGLTMEVQEQVNRQYRAFSVNCHFRLRGASPLRETGHIQIKSGDLFGRRGARCHAVDGSEGSQRLQAVLSSDECLADLLARLDFRLLDLRMTQGRWVLDIEHQAASELFSRMCAGGGYQHLSYAQRQLLLETLRRVRALMDDVGELSLAA